MVPRYPALAMPVEILHGEADKTVGLEIHSAPLAAQVPHARFTRLPGIGHLLHQVALPDVLQAMERMGREVYARRSAPFVPVRRAMTYMDPRMISGSVS